MDYILVTDLHLFRNISIWVTRHNKDHYMVLGCLQGASCRWHQRYLRRRTRLPVRPPILPIQEDEIDGVLFDDGQNYMPLDVSINVILSIYKTYTDYSPLVWHCEHF